MSYKSALKEFYIQQVVKALMDHFGYKNCHQVPSLEKIVINSGIKAIEEKKWVEEVQREITGVVGQHAVTTKARKSISNFKLREGMPIGVKCTLRGERMWEFLYRLINVALPGVRDFRGVSSKLDGHGNYTIGIVDHTIFPEVTFDGGSKKNIGMDITIVTSANTDDEGMKLLELLGMPFRSKSTTS